MLRSGGVYTPEWVAKLQRGVARHLSLPHRFVCFSDVDVPCERIPLLHDWPGWWSKIELFTNPIDGVTLYFDLDTVIVGSLDAIASHPHTFTMAHEFYRPALLCSTAMAWSGDHSYIAAAFAKRPEFLINAYDNLLPSGRIGDQAFIEDALDAHDPHGFRDTFRDLFGERSIASYKVHNCQDAPPADAAAVAFHGSPKPHQLSDGWVPALWK